jgi:hypothetical protein
MAFDKQYEVGRGRVVDQTVISTGRGGRPQQFHGAR